MYHLLVPVDFSSTSLNALKYALDVFSSTPIKVTVLHTYKAHTGAFTMKNMDAVLEEDATRQMDSLVARLEKENPDILIKPMVVNGEAVSCIASMGDSGKYDLIVMGTTGASGIKEVFMGSVAGGVISHTVAPVMVIPSSGTFEKIETIVLGVGNRSFDSAGVVEPLKHLQEVLDCKISIVHISDESDEGMDEILAPVKDLGEVVNLEREEGSADDQLSAHLEQVNGGIMALIRGKVDFLNRLLKGSVTMRQTFHSHVPILILHG